MMCNDENIFLYDELTEQERGAFDQHLRTCERCREKIADYQPIKFMIAASASEPPLPRNAAALTSSIMGQIQTREKNRLLSHLVNKSIWRYAMTAVSLALAILFYQELTIESVVTTTPVKDVNVKKVVFRMAVFRPAVRKGRNDSRMSLYDCAHQGTCQSTFVQKLKDHRNATY